MGAFLLTSCGGNGERKEQQLLKLKKEYAELGTKIKSLETELDRLDTISQKTRDVYVTSITPQVFKHYIDVQGSVDARENVDVSAKVGGVVKRILVREGQNVSAGQILAELEGDIYQTQIASVQTQLDFATDVYNRQKKLWDQKVGSEIQYLQTKNNKEALEKQLATLQENLDMTRIRSLISGTVDAVHLKLGQLAAPGYPAFRVMNYSDLKVVANVSEIYAPHIAEGNSVELVFPDLKKTISGNVKYASKVIDPMKRTFQTEVTLTGDKSAYRPNMVAIMKIVDYANDAAIVLPVNLIQTSEGESYVYKVEMKEGKEVAVKTPVTLGTSYNGQVEISAGLKAGDTVVTSGQFDLVDGASIRVQTK